MPHPMQNSTSAWVLAAAVGLAGCQEVIVERTAPEAYGDLTLDAEADATGLRSAVIVLSLPDGRVFTSARELPATWPVSYTVGGGLGSGTTSTGTVEAWLSTAAPAAAERELEPAAGAPRATGTVELPCDEDGFCDAVRLDLSLAAP
ncbi:MAG: hypothetical protein R2939_04600 [Kofleriaceae bacterium]